MTALYLGSGDEGVRETVHSAFLFSILTGLTLLYWSNIFKRYSGTFEHEAGIDRWGPNCCIRIYFLGMPALAVYNFGNAVFQCGGGYETTAEVSFHGRRCEYYFESLFVIVCKMDVAGVAVSVLFCNVVGCDDWRCTFQKQGYLWTALIGAASEQKQDCEYYQVGIPAGPECDAADRRSVCTGGREFADATMVTGNAAAANADALVYDVMTAFYTACGSFMGQNFGAGNRSVSGTAISSAWHIPLVSV